VLQLLDGSCFYARGEDGSRTLPTKAADGKFHIVGDMVVCPGEVQLEHLNGLKPIFDVIDKRPCLLVMPMPRYVIEGCCGDNTHISNRSDRHFREDMTLQLEGLKNTLKHYLFTTGRRSYHIIDTLAIWGCQMRTYGSATLCTQSAPYTTRLQAVSRWWRPS
jgi:hypothetical protein